MKNVTTSRRAVDEQGCVATQSQVAKPVPVGLEVPRPDDSAEGYVALAATLGRFFGMLLVARKQMAAPGGGRRDVRGSGR
jgi:hypothetical protein